MIDRNKILAARIALRVQFFAHMDYQLCGCPGHRAALEAFTQLVTDLRAGMTAEEVDQVTRELLEAQAATSATAPSAAN